MFDWDFTRQDWEDPAKRVTGPAFQWAPIDTVVIHYASGDQPDGDPGLGEDQPDVAAELRASQSWYLSDRGYSLGYNACVDVWGASWEIRGETYANAANKGHNRKHGHQHQYPGDPDKHNCNSHTFSIQVKLDHDDPATEPQLAEARRLIEYVRFHRPNVKIVGHQDLDYTQCPGVGVYDQVLKGLFVPNKDQDIGEDMVVFRLKGYAEVVLVIDCVPMPLSQPLAKELGLWDEVQDAMKNPLPDHATTRAWLERVFGAPLTPTPSSV